jgi:enamine deaminase RidA (YjgF/YER057c/UK114 family)
LPDDENDRKTKMTIDRKHTNNRLSQSVTHNGTVYLAGQVALNAPGGSVTEQTADILSAIDTLLAEAGTDKSKMLFATVWLSDISEAPAFNAIWDAWIPEGQAPARACVEGRLVSPDFTVEVAVTAAV